MRETSRRIRNDLSGELYASVPNRNWRGGGATKCECAERSDPIAGAPIKSQERNTRKRRQLAREADRPSPVGVGQLRAGVCLIRRHRRQTITSVVPMRSANKRISAIATARGGARHPSALPAEVGIFSSGIAVRSARPPRAYVVSDGSRVPSACPLSSPLSRSLITFSNTCPRTDSSAVLASTRPKNSRTVAMRPVHPV